MRHGRRFLAAGVLSAIFCGSARAQSASVVRAQSNIRAIAGESFDGATAGFSSIPALQDGFLRLVPQLIGKLSAPGAIPLVSDQLWYHLAPPNAPAMTLISSRLTDIYPTGVHEAPLTVVEQILDKGVQGKMSGLDFFTNPAWTNWRVYYVSPDNMAQVMSKYDTGALVPASGKSSDGKPFHMLAMTVGEGRLEMVFDRSEFDFKNPDYPGYTYVSSGVVEQFIVGPGDMLIKGLKVNFGLIHPTLEQIVKISANQSRIDTDWGSRTFTLAPISVRGKP